MADWIQTYTGRRVFPLAPSPSEIDIVDIAQGLACTPRFRGHTRRPYSVAQHSVLLSRLVDPACAFVALLHDAAEAYLSDMPAPVKRDMPEYRAAEDRLLDVIADRFGFAKFLYHGALPFHVHGADFRLCVTEARQLLPDPPLGDWDKAAEPFNIRIRPWGWRKARRRFLRRFYELIDKELAL